MSTTHRTCTRFLLVALALLLGGAPRLLADVTVDDGSPDTFQEALDEVVVEGGTITVTFPITVDDARTFEGFGNVTIDGGDTNGLFIVNGFGNLTLDGFVLTGGRSTNGGAIYIDFDATVVVTNCVFTGNNAVGTNGLPGADGSAGSTGDNGTRGGAADPARGGAIYNLGELLVENCQFLTNSAIGGDGGAGGNGGNGAFQGGNGGSGGAGGFALGGAIYNTGFITVIDCTFDNNQATGGDGGDGGDPGTGALAGIIGNGAPAGYATGAGIYTDTGTNAVVLIIGSTFSDNVAQGGNSGSGSNKFGSGAPRGAQGAGGGVANVGLLAVENSTFFRNRALGGNGGDGGKGGSGGAAFGGGIFNTGGVAVAFCTFSSGSAVGGTNGAVGGVVLVNSGKQGKGQGGNMAHVGPKLPGFYFTLRDSIVSTNLGGGSGFGKIQDIGQNIISDKSIKTGSGSLKKTDAKLGPLADNGGPTFTMAIAMDSPARDFGPTNGSPDYFFYDQRRVPRDDPNDVGAYEFSTLPPQVSLTVSGTNVAGLTLVQTNGGTITLTATALGDPPFTYRWFAQTNGSSTNVQVKATSNSQLFQNSLSITNLSTNNAGTYYVVVSNKFGATQSPNVNIIVSNSTAAGPTITTQPSDQTVNRGETATFSVAATGDAPLFYQWRFNGTNVGANTNVLEVLNAQATNIGSYTVVITNAVGSATSSTATINMRPFITVQPTNQTVGLGSNFTFVVAAGGSTTLTYKWYHNGAEAPGGAAPAFSKSSASTNDAGDYFVIVANSFGSIQSATATLIVTSTAPGAPFVPQNTSSDISVPRPPPVISAPTITSSDFTFSFLSQAGVTYNIQSSDTLTDADWATIDTTVGTGDWLTNDIPATNSRRFFRILVK